MLHKSTSNKIYCFIYSKQHKTSAGPEGSYKAVIVFNINVYCNKFTLLTKIYVKCKYVTCKYTHQ